MEATGALLFGYLRNQEATISGDPEDGRFFSARVKPKQLPAKDVLITPRSHDDIARRLARIFKRDSKEVAERLNAVGIFTASAFYHRLRNYQPEIEVFSDYLGVSRNSIERFLETMEQNRSTRALVAAPPRIPVSRGVNLARLSKVTKTRRKKRASKKPPKFPQTQRTPNLASKVDLRKRVTKVRDQGPFRGTCVAHTAAAMLEHELIRYGPYNRRLDLSEQQIYWACKHLDGASDQEGTFIEYAMQALRQGVPETVMPEPGTCKEHRWRYSTSPVEDNEAQGPPPASAIKARRYDCSHAYKLDKRSIRELKERLASGHCVGLSVYTYHFWTDGYAWREGRISLPISIEPDGAHAVCLVGYEDRDGTHGEGSFLFKNSWGTNWGVQRPDPGFGHLPYRYILKEAIEAWAMEL